MIDKTHIIGRILPTAIAVGATLGGVALCQWSGLSGWTLYGAAIGLGLAISALIRSHGTHFAQLLTLTEQLERVNAGDRLDLSVRLDVPSDPKVAHLAQVYNRLADDVQKMVQEFSKTSTELGILSARISEVTETTEREVFRQQQETDQVATAMNQMSATVTEVARHAANAAEAAHNADRSAVEGEQIATETKSVIEALAGEVERAAQVIHKLDEESNEIGMVLDVIKNIAEQTNLLALNAAIEAARAGEQGRGFAVVADEVRTLASRTQQSTQEIEEMISRLQAGANQSVKVMEAALEKGREGSAQMERTAEALNQIRQAVDVINEMNTQIATAVEEQSAVANEINHNITVISEVAHHTTEGAKESREAAAHLAELSMELQGYVRHYELGTGNTLDLSAAKAAHLAWKARLRAFLDGQEALTEEQAVSHKHCDFGKWYYGVGLAKYSHLQTLREVEAPHEELHTLIREIIRLKNAGDVEGAEAGYEQVGVISQRIVELLDRLEREVNSGA